MRFPHSPTLAAGLILGSVATSATAADGLHWYRGNTHTHGVVEGYAPDVVSDWFAGHGYDFIVSTEHERVLRHDEFKHLPKNFLVIRGQEITEIVRDDARTDGVRHVHVNALGTQSVIQPARQAPPSGQKAPTTPHEFKEFFRSTAARLSPLEAYRRNLEAVRKQGGLPQVNHPNLSWSVRPSDLLPLEGPYLLEIANQFPLANNQGGSTPAGDSAPSTESLWDQLLSAGKVVWGVASDDSHDYTHFDQRGALTPGHGWIVVRARSLDRDALIAAMRAGDFYASTGVGITDIRTDGKTLTIDIAATAPLDPKLPSVPDSRFSTRFIGKDGRVLAQVVGRSAVYRFRGDESYVRATISDSDGRLAWTQPVFLDGRSGSKKQ